MEETAVQHKKVVFSGIKPTGQLTIGNYIGAIENMLKLQEKYDCFYSVVDLHSITVDIEPALLRKNSLDALALYIAAGLDPQQSTLFLQSHVPEHSELTWILNCFTMMGEAKRMIQFKEKSAADPKNVNVGLFDYPVLMAADILLYQTDLVPIGQDQKQHLELARVVAQRFNGKFTPTFVVPEGMIPKHGAKIYSLLEPLAKMGKTDENPNGTVFLLDDTDTIMRKFKRAVTDSGSEIVFRADKPGISNLITIYSAFTGKTVKQTEQIFAGVSYAQFKQSVGEAAAERLIQIQGEYKRIVSDKAYLSSIMAQGRDKARRAAAKTLAKVQRKVGFVRPE